MTRIFLYVVVFSLSINSTIYAQQIESNYKTGSFVDQSKQTIDGYIDFTYSSKKTTVCSLALGADYTPGYYYDLTNHKIAGNIKYIQSNTFFRYSLNGETDSKKIKPDESLGYVLGNDSFAVINDFSVEREIGSFANSGPEFAEVVTTINDLTFYHHTRVGSKSITSTYMVRKGKDGILESFSKINEKFKVTALKYFGHIPYLKTKIEEGEYSAEQILILIKYFEFQTKYERGEKIYYTSSWEETKDTSLASYYMKIENVLKSKWTLSHYQKNGVPLYQGVYYSLTSMKKEGRFSFYYADGTVRKIIKYVANEIKDSILEFYPNGKLHYEYEKKDEFKYTYIKILDQNGNDVLDKSGNGKEVFFDSIRNREITRIYESYKLETAFYTSDKGNRVYQAGKRVGIVKPEYTSTTELSLNYPLGSVAQSNHGLVMARILANKEGKTTSISIIKGVDAQCDQQVLTYCRALYNVNNGNIWFPVKFDKQLVEQEIIVSFLFQIQGFSRYRNGYYNSNMWQQQMIMQQQMMMQAMPRF
ncbi:MAG TPA: hypothetical protein VNW06_01395 [Cytophagaceae bacterium]|jgi:hypothetical protein|nr:hypothetical protein [Cytophagaceae bacterium]